MASDVAVRPRRVQPTDRRDRFVDVVVGAFDRVLEHGREGGERDGRRIDQDQRRGDEAGRRHCGRGHRAPAVADDPQVGALQAGRSGERDEVRRVVAEPVVA